MARGVVACAWGQIFDGDLIGRLFADGFARGGRSCRRIGRICRWLLLCFLRLGLRRLRIGRIYRISSFFRVLLRQALGKRGRLGDRTYLGCQLLLAETKLLKNAARRIVALGVNPRRVERIDAAGYLQESRCLHERRFANPWHFLDLFAGLEWPFLLAVLEEPPRGELIESRYISQQRRAGCVQINTDVIHTRLDNSIERLLQMLRFHVVLIKPHADVGGIDLHKFRKRIEQAAANGNGTTLGRFILTEFFSANRAGGVHACASLVDDHVGNVFTLEFISEHVSDKMFGFPAGGAVTDGNNGDLVQFDHLDKAGAAALFALFGANEEDRPVPVHHTEFVERCQLAPATEARINCEHPLP